MLWIVVAQIRDKWRRSVVSVVMGLAEPQYGGIS